MRDDGDINTRRDSEEPQAPAKLVAALKEPLARRVFVPPTIDQAVLGAARRQLEKTPARRSLWRPWFAWPALAAACLMFVGLIHSLTKQTPAFAREDLNHDGRVDILDAFQLAREIQSGAKPALDLNGDGVVDQRDADLI